MANAEKEEGLFPEPAIRVIRLPEKERKHTKVLLNNQGLQMASDPCSSARL